MFNRIDHVAFSVRNREKSIRFYEEKFGFKNYFEHDVPAPEIEKISYLRLGDTVLELIHMPAMLDGSGFHFCLISDDFDGDFKRLADSGVEVAQQSHPTSARVPNEEGWKRTVFKGPDGEMIEMRG